MSKFTPKNITIVVLLAILLFSVLKLASYLRERKDIEKVISEVQEEAGAVHAQAQNLLQDLENEKTGVEKLRQQNAALKEYLRASKRRMGKLFVEKSAAQEKLTDLDARFSVVKAENSALAQQNQMYTQENESLKSRLNSLVELKKAIREVKIRMREAQQAAWRMSHPRTPDIELAGNRGYLVRNGQSTQSALVKIEVTPTAGL